MTAILRLWSFVLRPGKSHLSKCPNKRAHTAHRTPVIGHANILVRRVDERALIAGSAAAGDWRAERRRHRVEWPSAGHSRVDHRLLLERRADRVGHCAYHWRVGVGAGGALVAEFENLDIAEAIG